MKCQNQKCNAENANDAQFCRACGYPLVEIPTNVMDLYPEYKFIPTNLEKWRLNGTAALILLAAAFAILFVCVSIVPFAKSTRSVSLFEFVVPVLFLCFSVLFFVGAKKNFPSKKTPKLSEVADYVQKFEAYKSTCFSFYIKDGKFGVLNMSKYKVQIPAQYDKLSWREKGRYLNAIKGSENIIIDINGKILK